MTGPDSELEEEKSEDKPTDKEVAATPESSKPDQKDLSDKTESVETDADAKSDAKSEKKEELVSDSDSKSDDKKSDESKLDANTEKKDIADKESADKEPAAESDADKPKEPASSDADSAAANEKASTITLTQHHVSHLLADVLQENAEEAPVVRGLRFPMVLDLLLGLGLLVAVGGFTIGLFHMYIVHSASQSISEQRYKAAITILKAAPLPAVFARPGSDTEELLSKAIYMDAMDKLEAGTDLEEAVKELSEINPASKFFALAQEAINENTEPAPMMLQGGAETTETNPVDNAEEKQSLLEKTLREEEHR